MKNFLLTGECNWEFFLLMVNNSDLSRKILIEPNSTNFLWFSSPITFLTYCLFRLYIADFKSNITVRSLWMKIYIWVKPWKYTRYFPNVTTHRKKYLKWFYSKPWPLALLLLTTYRYSNNCFLFGRITYIFN